MVPSLAITLVVGLFLGQAPGLTYSRDISVRQNAGDDQAMKGAQLTRRNIGALSARSYQEEYSHHSTGNFEAEVQYEQDSSQGDSDLITERDDGIQKDNYDSGKENYNSGNANSGSASSDNKSDPSTKDDASSYSSSKDSSSDKDPKKQYGSDQKNSEQYKEVKSDPTNNNPDGQYGTNAVSKDDGNYDSSKSDKSDGSYKHENVPSHVDHQPISVPKGTKK